MEDDIISLSSSSRPSSPFFNVSEVFNDSEKRKSSIHHGMIDDLDLGLNSSVSLNEYNNLHPTQFQKSPIKLRKVHNLSDSDDCSSSDSRPKKNNEHDWPMHYENSEGETSTQYSILRDEPNFICNSPPKKQLVERTVKAKLTKEERLEEKERKRKEKEKIRNEKRALQELQNQMKPGNCMKYMTAVLDSSLVNCPFSGTVLAAIQNSESKYVVSSQDVPFSICWTRDLPGSEKKEEDFMVLLWQWQMFIPAVKNHTLCFQIQEIQSQSPNKSISLVIYGLNGYFSYLKSRSRKGTDNSSNTRKRKQNVEDEEFPFLTKHNIEEELIELQIMTKCNHRLIESQEELGQLVVNITKAIAETPYKMDKQRRELENLEWFAVGDSRDCVAVDKAGNGLLRLWQQQLCQFNMAGHDIAHAIAKTYPSPTSLMQAYKKCSTKEEGEALLKDILIRRCQGPISSTRRIGPELSKKIYTFFYSIDGDIPLSQEK